MTKRKTAMKVAMCGPTPVAKKPHTGVVPDKTFDFYCGTISSDITDKVIHKDKQGDLITLLLSHLALFLSSSQYPFTNLLFFCHCDSHLLAFATYLPQIQTLLTLHKFSLSHCLDL